MGETRTKILSVTAKPDFKNNVMSIITHLLIEKIRDYVVVKPTTIVITSWYEHITAIDKVWKFQGKVVKRERVPTSIKRFLSVTTSRIEGKPITMPAEQYKPKSKKTGSVVKKTEPLPA